jgi:HEAT repeat protein
LAFWLGTLTLLLAIGPIAADAAASDPAEATLQAARDRAVAVVREASRSVDGGRRAAAIEAAKADRDLAVPLIQLGLRDDDPRVRYRALMAVGELGLKGLGASAADHVGDASPSVRAAAIYAAASNGRAVDRTPLAGLLREPLATCRMHTAEVLARLGDASARPMIESAAGLPLRGANVQQERAVQIKLAEAMARLGDRSAVDVVRGAMYEPAIEVRVAAIDTLGRLGDRRMQPALSRLVREAPLEVKMTAAASLLRIGDASGLPTLRRGATYTAERAAADLREALRQTPPQWAAAAEMQAVLADPARLAAAAEAVRGQAAYGLGLSEDEASAGALVALLDDPSAEVRLAAAGAVLSATAR